MDTQLSEIIISLINYADKGEHINFKFIECLTEFFEIKDQYKKVDCVISCLQASMKRLFKTYCKEIICQKGDITKLLAYSVLSDTIEFYKKELLIIAEMLDEYIAYLNSGNFLKALIGNHRTESDFWDYRGGMKWNIR